MGCGSGMESSRGLVEGVRGRALFGGARVPHAGTASQFRSNLPD